MRRAPSRRGAVRPWRARVLALLAIRPEDVEADLQEALRHASSTCRPYVLTLWANHLESNGRHADALQAFEEAMADLRGLPEEVLQVEDTALFLWWPRLVLADAAQGKGWALHALGRDEEALAAAEESLRQKPMRPEALLLRARLAWRRGDLDAPRTDAEAGLGSPVPGVAPSVRGLLAKVLAEVGLARKDLAAAEAAGEEALRWTPRRMTAWVLRVRVHGAARRWDRAFQAVERASELRRGQVGLREDGWRGLRATCLQHLGRNAEGLEILDQLASDVPVLGLVSRAPAPRGPAGRILVAHRRNVVVISSADRPLPARRPPSGGRVPERSRATYWGLRSMAPGLGTGTRTS